MSTHTTLKGVSSIYDSTLSDQLESNYLNFFQWGFLGVGGFFNVSNNQSGVYGGNESRLRLVDDPNYEVGQVWESFRKDWVYESGIEYPVQPIRPSGVNVNGSFKSSSSTGVYAHNIDYPLGRVIFNSPIPATSIVTCEYSYRLFQLYTADSDWWQQIQNNSFRVDNPHFLQFGSGEWDILAQNRIQLPAVVIEAIPNVSSRRGFEIGNLTQIVEQDVLFHVLAEDRFYYKWLHDCITNQNQKRLSGFDKNIAILENKFPLDSYGFINPSGKFYPDLVKPSGDGGCYWKQIRFEEVRSSEYPKMGTVNYCVVRIKTGVDIP